MTTTTPHPTIPATWAPTGVGCHARNDFWIWDFHSANDKKTVLGGPSQLDETATCFPTSWAPTYRATECPNGYSSACRAGNTTDPVTYCPTAYAFSCVENANRNPHGSWFQCMSQYTATANVTVTRTDFIANTITFEPTPLLTRNHLFALGVVYATATETGESPAPSSDDTTSTSTSSGSSISAGAAAGIGVGSAAGIVLLALLVWGICRRKRPKTDAPLGVTQNTEVVSEAKGRHEQVQPMELSAQSQRRELEG